MKTILTLCVIILFSCSKYTEQAAISDVNKANDKFPAPVAKWTRAKYPCIAKQSDTITKVKDTVVFIDCPDLPTIVHEPGDTVINEVVRTKIVKVPVNLPVQTRYITTYIEDSAKIFGLSAELIKADDIIKKQNFLIDEQKAKIKVRNKWVLWLLIALVISTGLHFVKLKLPFLN